MCFCVALSRYVGVDIAVDSLKHFVEERLLMPSNTDAQRQKVSHLVSADMGRDSLSSSTLATHTWVKEPESTLRSVWDERYGLLR